MSRVSILVNPIGHLIVFDLFSSLLLGILLHNIFYSLPFFFNRDLEIVQSYQLICLTFIKRYYGMSLFR